MKLSTFKERHNRLQAEARKLQVRLEDDTERAKLNINAQKGVSPLHLSSFNNFCHSTIVFLHFRLESSMTLIWDKAYWRTPKTYTGWTTSWIRSSDRATRPSTSWVVPMPIYITSAASSNQSRTRTWTLLPTCSLVSKLLLPFPGKKWSKEQFFTWQSSYCL